MATGFHMLFVVNTCHALLADQLQSFGMATGFDKLFVVNTCQALLADQLQSSGIGDRVW